LHGDVRRIDERQRGDGVARATGVGDSLPHSREQFGRLARVVALLLAAPLAIAGKLQQ